QTEMLEALTSVPRQIAALVQEEKLYEELAHRFSHVSDVLYLGRGASYPIALEGALKLKEISYIHAEGYAAGELKHGPIALIDEDMPVVVVAPSDTLLEKTISNAQEVAARGGQLVLVTDVDPETFGCTPAAHIPIPTVHPFTAPLVSAIPMQLIAYFTAVQMGTDVDQPRNLAKSVTVE
ncbi:MAG: SIS domain-containing protein, partial [Pseudomonadota bacterium]